MFEITIQLEFCYGHRLCKHEGKCQWLHGHNGLLEVTVASPKLDDNNMVMDFSDLKKELKDWVDENFDHAMVLSKHDPLLKPLQEYNQRIYVMNDEPTAEFMAYEIYTAMRSKGMNIVEVKLWETRKNSATYKVPVSCE